MAESSEHRFRFVILGRYPARMKGNQTAVTVNMSAGERGRLVHCGTLTLAEDEFATLVDALGANLGDRVELEDHSQDHPPP
jgi:hypothetical protein